MFDPIPDPRTADRLAEDVRRLTLDLSNALILDHEHGLHEEHYDSTIGCTYPGCDDAYTFIAREQEAGR